ncbi:hypothetical protein PBV87_13680 [Niameybacter massiliensis]|uniref:Uncharacterized protein n=1 Tax=Holtiella tumoricola TaxID=3018743 RepID=A0AA42DP70_9FIRM|nr:MULTISPECIES: hypothetical protein [Lachnospirales]MDA3732537.1 hypothetical protein [Holtiella tumoricola]
MENTQQSKLDLIYEDTKTRTLEHLERLKKTEDKEVIESDRIFQYLQQTIDCLQLCIEHLPQTSMTRQRYAKYKDELGELGEDVVKLTSPNRW